MLGKIKTVLQMFAIIFLMLKKFAICICRYSNGSDLVMGCNDRISCKWNSIFHTIKRYCYGVNVNGRTVRLSEKNKHLTIGSCESFTAGLFCAKLAEISGASAVLKGGIVTYATDIKTNVVGVSSEVVEKDGVISSSRKKKWH